MDPDKALADARVALKEFREHPCELLTGSIDKHDLASDELAYAFEALDGWLSNGGFLPQDWSRR